MIMNIDVYIFSQQNGKLLILFRMTGGILQMLLKSTFATV